MQLYYQNTESGCVPACLASLLDVDPHEIPDIYGSQYINKEVSWRLLNAYVLRYECRLVYTKTDTIPTNGWYITLVKATSNYDHAVLSYNGRIIHDPWKQGLTRYVIDGIIRLENISQS